MVAKTAIDGPAIFDKAAEYDAWGNTVTLPGLGTPRHQFVDFEPDQATGYYYMGARVYDPTLRRWLSPDPLMLGMPQATTGSGRQLNLYAYATNNPAVVVDPSGLMGDEEQELNADFMEAAGGGDLPLATEEASAGDESSSSGQGETDGETTATGDDGTSHSGGSSDDSEEDTSAAGSSGLPSTGDTNLDIEQDYSGIHIEQQPKSTEQDSVLADSVGNQFDLKSLENKNILPDKVSTGRNGGRTAMTGGPKNAIVQTRGGHALVYDENGRYLMDISKQRIKMAEWNKAPNGKWYGSQNGTKLFRRGVPEQILRLVGLIK